MDRRNFLALLGAGAFEVRAGQQPPASEPARVESITAPATPAIALNHLGFLPDARKVLVFRGTPPSPAQFSMREIGTHPGVVIELTRPLTKVTGDLGNCSIGDFSELKTEGMYQVTVGSERSVPFFLRPDVWRRTLPRAVSYVHAQRCGVAVPNVHPACHLDDARRDDTGEHVDVTGGWHSAGDLRKTGTTMTSALGLLYLARNLGGRWDLAGSGLPPLLDEIQWGNRYFLKIQEPGGVIWNDTAIGASGDNRDNRWTDNIVGNSDDRKAGTRKTGLFQAMFIILQAMAAQVFRETDPGYAQTCLAAGRRCWEAAKMGTIFTRDPLLAHFWTATTELGWWTEAALELYRATNQLAYEAAATELGRQLLSLFTRDFVGSQKTVRGFWRSSPDNPAPNVDPVYSALPALALLDLSLVFPKHADSSRWRDAVRLHLDEYVLPLSARSAFRMVPYGIFLGSPTAEYYRPLAGEVTYRYFMPVRKQYWWLGTTSHLEGYAVLLGMAAKAFGRREYRDLAYRQLEWVMGANPFGACLMTGEGMRNPFPHSRFVGLIPGGILNGIAGNSRDEPVLDIEYGGDWRTCEYWCPHNAFYAWALSVLESV